ncbi:MAG: SpaH/EbpB family LPXTG-anchored major pilin [Oscillospiraceae bacterium]|nr:SpaH/EbpB family LPXTG-anchored major pilin [Oscillospiraceae bacterium]
MSVGIVTSMATPGLPPAFGDLYIHKYVGATEGANNDGTELDSGAWAATPANNVVFNLFKVGAPVAAVPEWPEVPPLGAYSISGGNLVVTDASVTTGIYSLSSAGSFITGVSGAPPLDGVAIANGLAQGIYLVVEDAVESRLLGIEDPSGEPLSIVAAVAPFLVAVPMTTADGAGWLDEVHVYPKNEEMSIRKYVDPDGETITVGDTVTYSLEFFLPGDVGAAVTLDIFDALDEALTFVPESLSVTTISATTLTKGTGGAGDYSVDYFEEYGVIIVSFTHAGIVKLDGLTSVIVEFDCVVNDAIRAYADLTVSNTATVEFTNEYGISYSINADLYVDIHTAAIKVVKVDGGGAPLPGAEFKIATSAANAAAGGFIRLDPDTGALIDYDPAPASEWDSLGAANDYIGETDGNITIFSGLTDYAGDSYQTYYIVETKAPPGFNLQSYAKEVTFTGDEDNYTLEVVVTNSAGFLLPQTGGFGTIIWTVSGIALLGAAAIVLVARKKPGKTVAGAGVGAGAEAEGK